MKQGKAHSIITTQEIQRRLENGANELRGSMDASRYIDHMLGLMFYKFLSDKTLQPFSHNAHVTGTGVEFARAYQNKYDKYYGAFGSGGLRASAK